MELIYLWIDGYKNLKNFNISLNPSYEGYIDNEKDKSEHLKIILKENTNHLNIFWGKS